MWSWWERVLLSFVLLLLHLCLALDFRSNTFKILDHANNDPFENERAPENHAPQGGLAGQPTVYTSRSGNPYAQFLPATAEPSPYNPAPAPLNPAPYQPVSEFPHQFEFATVPARPSTTQRTTQKVKTASLSTSTRRPIKLSRLGAEKKTNDSIQSIASSRLMNDILVIPSKRRLYILAILPLHESSDNKGFECGRLDVHSYVRLAAFIDSLQAVNDGPSMRDAGLSLGAVVLDSCSSDLRTVADIYQLLSGTNIQKSDLIAMVRDDGSYLPNLDSLAAHLKLPVINTYFSHQNKPLSTGVLPLISSPLSAIIDLLVHTSSTCVNLLYDQLHAHAAAEFVSLAEHRGVCVDAKIHINAASPAPSSVRRLLLSEARVVVALLGDTSWLHLLTAFRSEAVIAGRFIVMSVETPRWTSSRQLTDAWSQFDQLLISVGGRTPPQSSYFDQLTAVFPKLPFPSHWMKQFWSTAFRCHIEGEATPGEQFSRPCSLSQQLNLTQLAPSVDVAPVSLALHSIAHAVRALVDSVCPGALIHTLTDCLNDPSEALFESIKAAHFHNGLSPDGVFFNQSTGYRDTELLLNRVFFSSQLEFDPIATWQAASGLHYEGAELTLVERDGSRVSLRSTCPKSSCASAMQRSVEARSQPAISESLRSVPLMVFACLASLLTFVSLMCMYQQLVAGKDDPFAICTMYTFAGVAVSCLVSVFFVMSPNALSCSVRRTGLSIAMAVVYVPMLVKTGFAVRSGDAAHSSLGRPSQKAMFWTATALVAAQMIAVFEWAWFDPSAALSLSSHNGQYAWRCAPGQQSETGLLLSCLPVCACLLATLIWSVLGVRHIECRQNVLLTALPLVSLLSLYIALPMIPFRARDAVLAGVLICLSSLTLLISYCRGAFRPSSPAPTELSNGSMSIPHEKIYSANNTMMQPSYRPQSMQLAKHLDVLDPSSIQYSQQYYGTQTTQPIASMPRVLPSNLPHKYGADKFVHDEYDRL